MAELINKTDTLNEGREKLNAAITDVEVAKGTSNQAVSISNQARQIAKIAEDKADSTQTQLDTLVIESGTSDAEVLQARVDEKGGSYKNLKSRIDDGFTTVTSQLEDTSYAEGDLVELLQSYSVLKEHVIVKVRDVNTIDIGVFYKENKATIYTMKPDEDGWWRLFDVINRPLSSIELNTQKNWDSKTGDWVTSSPPMYYTTEVGGTFKFDFFGTGFNFNSFTDNRGGLWEFIVDGKIRKNISVHSKSSGYKTQTVSYGLENKKHTVVATFKGADPNNAPIDGIARGWANFYDSSGSTYNKTIEYWQNTFENENGIVIMQANSRKEFAFSCKPSSHSGSVVWVPEHGETGVMNITSFKIYFGEREITDLSLEENIYYRYPDVRFVTEYEAKHPSSNVVMWLGRIDQTINGSGFHTRGRMKFQNDTFISSGYPAMLAMSTATLRVNTAVTSDGKRYALPTDINDNSNIKINGDISNLCMFTDLITSSEFARHTLAAIRVYDFKRIMRKGKQGNSSDPIVVRLRTDGYRKAYFKAYEDYTEVAGTTYDFGCTYFCGEIKNVSEILP